MLAIFKNIFLTIIFILVIYVPNLSFFPHLSWFLAFLGLLSLLDRNFEASIGFNKNNNKNFLQYLIFVLIFNIIIVPVIHGLVDLSYIPLQIGIILSILRSILLVYCLYKCYGNEIFLQYSKFLLLACCIYVTFTLLFIVYPEFKEYWLYSILSDVEDRSEDFAVYAFRYSLDGFAAFSSASIFSFACLFSCYLISSNPKHLLIKVVCLMLMVIGCFFYGRISLVGMLLGVILIFWSAKKLGVLLKIASIIILSTIGILSILNIASQSNETLLLWQDWAFAIVKQIFVEKEVTDHSVTHMVNDMYYMPNIFTFLFGDGMYTDTNGSYYGHTDVGFMRIILYSGICGLILIYSLVIYLAKTVIKASNSIIFKRFIFLSTILFFVLEMKGESYQRAIMMLYPFILILNNMKYLKLHKIKS